MLGEPGACISEWEQVTGTVEEAGAVTLRLQSRAQDLSLQRL